MGVEDERDDQTVGIEMNTYMTPKNVKTNGYMISMRMSVFSCQIMRLKESNY